MRVLIVIAHPGHVHLFKNMVWKLEEHGHTVKILAREKEMVFYLLDKYGFEYTPIGKMHSTKIGKAYELITTDYKCYKLARKFDPDILIDLGLYGVHAARLTGKPSIVFNDTEWLKFKDILSYPFTDVICTPSCFKEDLSKKQVRYNGYHELAYLHPNYFKPDPSVLGELGLGEGERFIVVRFTSWTASPDTNLHGLTNKKELVKKLENYGRVFITSESELSEDLKEYKMLISPEKLHSALYYASLYIGDGGTTAVEAALLGTPAVHFEAFKSKSKRTVDATRFGNFDELVNKYGMLYTFCDQNKAINKALELLQDENAKQVLKSKREQLLKEKIDVTEFMVDFIENYPESLRLYNERGMVSSKNA
ncbi:MAG TPA: DUF354 domain-containing protein [Dehalococcoidia bacterium]|nr:DUF354 domain-containing protein [Dehalococcoidia bacterium]